MATHAHSVRDQVRTFPFASQRSKTLAALGTSLASGSLFLVAVLSVLHPEGMR